jgi:hypothetical protein
MRTRAITTSTLIVASTPMNRTNPLPRRHQLTDLIAYTGRSAAMASRPRREQVWDVSCRGHHSGLVCSRFALRLVVVHFYLGPEPQTPRCDGRSHVRPYTAVGGRIRPVLPNTCRGFVPAAEASRLRLRAGPPSRGTSSGLPFRRSVPLQGGPKRATHAADRARVRAAAASWPDTQAARRLAVEQRSRAAPTTGRSSGAGREGRWG